MNAWELRGYIFLIMSQMATYGDAPYWIRWVFLGISLSQFAIGWYGSYQEYKIDAERYAELRDKIKD